MSVCPSCAARDVPIYLHSVCVFVAHIMYAYMYTFIYVNVSIHFAYCVCVFRASFRIISVHIFTHASHQVGSLRDRFPRTVSIIAVTDDVYLCTLFVYLSVHTSKKKKKTSKPFLSSIENIIETFVLPFIHPSPRHRPTYLSFGRNSVSQPGGEKTITYHYNTNTCFLDRM